MRLELRNLQMGSMFDVSSVKICCIRNELILAGTDNVFLGYGQCRTFLNTGATGRLFILLLHIICFGSLETMILPVFWRLV